MAIVKMSKFTLFAFKKDKEALLAGLQEFEGVQFVNLQDKVEEEALSLLQVDSEEVKASNLEGEQGKVKSALDFLNQYQPKQKGFKALTVGKRSLTYDELAGEAKKSDYLQTAERLKQIEQRLGYLKSEQVRLNAEILLLKPWHSFDAPMSALNKFTYSKSYLGTIPFNLKEKFKQELEAQIKTVFVEQISEGKEGVNFFLLVHASESIILEEIFKKYGFTAATFNFEGTCKAHTQDLQAAITAYQKEIDENVSSIQLFSNEMLYLEVGYEYLSNEVIKSRSTSNFLKTDQVVMIEGWVTKENSDALITVVNTITQEKSHIEVVDPSDSDDVPILLKNNKLVAPFEAFVSMYGMPKYKGIDPTLAIVPFYMLFYGLMLSDAMYGLIQLIGCAFILKKFKLDDSARKMVRMFLYLSYPTIIVGILYGSYFTGAIKIPPVWIDPTKQAILVLLVSFGLGLIHIFTGLGIKAYVLIRDGHPLDAFYDVGLWIITLVSGLLFLGGSFGKIEALMNIATPIKYTMFAGMIALVLTQGRANKGIGARLGAGVYGLYGITGYIGDIVSYSRLMALGLATSFIGGAFNSIIELLGHGVAVWIFGPIIFIIGHVFNLSINALGGYVHSLRLQYLEYFGKFYESGGKEFAPLKSKSKFINIIKN